MPESNTQNGHLSPFLEIDREDWAALAPTMEAPLSAAEIAKLQGLGDVLDLREVSEVYLPLSGLLSLYVNAAKELHRSTTEYLGATSTTTPFVIGIAGSVAVGKSTIARLLHTLLGRWEGTPHVELVTTDGFLLPNAELERRGLMERKGFPESYDRRALLRFVSQIKSGAPEVAANVYSHLSYDIVAGAQVVVKRPDVLIVEGLNVLQPATAGHRLAVSDLFDFTIYVDARTSDIATWYEERFLSLQRSAFSNPASYFHRISALSEHEARTLARGLWANINEPNLEQNILPTKARASLVLRKNANHTVDTVLLRKI
jgi:type I pantothenate kinase